MVGFLLTNDERRRFCEWLRQDLESTRELARLVEKLPFGSAAMTQKLKADMMASAIVLNKLESAERQTISAPSPAPLPEARP